MLGLVTGKTEFDDFVKSSDWHGAYLKETHFSRAQFQRIETDGSSSTICSADSILRLLVAFPEDDHSLEIVLFNAEEFTLYPSYDLDVDKSARIQRRLAEADFGAFSCKCACLGFQHLPIAAVSASPHYSSESLFENGCFSQAPYNVDWRAVLDEAFKRL
jgi:hypothetical protein